MSVLAMLSDEICASIGNVASCQHCQYCQMRSVSVLAMLSNELSASIGNVVRGDLCQHRQCCQMRCVSVLAMLPVCQLSGPALASVWRVWFGNTASAGSQLALLWSPEYYW